MPEDKEMHKYFICGLFLVGTMFRSVAAQEQQSQMPDRTTSTELVVQIVKAAQRHAKVHGDKYPPAFSPSEQLLLGNGAAIDLKVFRQATGAPIIVWTVDDVAHMRLFIRERVEGIISDRPDILRQVVHGEAELPRTNRKDDPGYFTHFDVEAHAGGKGLRPENTLPAYETALDSLATTIETDTGLTKDGISVVSHDSSLSPEYCRRNDGKPYADADRVLLKDITLAEAQKTFTCDKISTAGTQKNDPILNPVAMAFSKTLALASPYAPVSVEQLYRFVAFYVEYYKTGPGKNLPQAGQRWRNALSVRFNLEIKINLRPSRQQETFGPERFVDALCGTIMRAHMDSRSDVQSFNFQSLLLVQEKFPAIRTVYLFGTVDPRLRYLLPPALLEEVSERNTGPLPPDDK